jgi:hypothetical protein
MKKSTIATLFLVSLMTEAAADPQFYGSWVEVETGLQIDVLDGFKPNAGPILIFDEDGGVTSDSWKSSEGKFELTFEYNRYDASINESGALVLSPNYGDELIFNQIDTGETTASITLKDDEVAFISRLQDSIWLMSDDGSEAVFKSTFGPDTGVLETVQNNDLVDLRGWSVSSGVLKVGDNVIVEARLSSRYFVGLDQRDNFIVFKVSGVAEQQIKTDLEAEREKFFDELLTGEWISKIYGTEYIHKFRPVYGDLSGEVFTLKDGRLNSDEGWEYSPGTGALRIGYTNYVGASIVNSTLALIQENGDQKFFNKLKNGNDKRFTLGDVKSTQMSEASLRKVNEMLSPQMQRGNFLYAFEFKQDGRTGFAHQWTSSPFTVTGDTFESNLFGRVKNLFQVEDFIIFEDNAIFKMDSSVSRLKPKTDDEAAQDVEKEKQNQRSLKENTLKVRVRTVAGDSFDVPLPIGSFSDISSVSIVVE